MTQQSPKLQDTRVIVEGGADDCRVVVEGEGARRVIVEGVPREVAERIAATWNFCEGFSTESLQPATLHMLMDAMD